MPPTTRPPITRHRVPRAGLDPIDDVDTAFATIAAAVTRPLRDETIVVLLDDARCGLAIAVVAGTDRPDDVLEVVEFFSNPLAHGGRVAAMVVGSVRPTGGCPPGDDRDVDRWLEMSDLTDHAGIELLEWFVIASVVSCPRDHLAEPPRWPRDVAERARAGARRP